MFLKDKVKLFRDKIVKFREKYPNRARYIKYIRWFVNILMIFLVIIFLLVRNTSLNITHSLKTGLYLHYPILTEIKRDDYVMLNPEKFEYVYKTNYKSSDFNDTKILKQVKGLPGDLIEYKDNKIFINNEDFGFVFLINGYDNAHKDGESFKLKENEYYVLGTSTLSFDSRYIGSFKKEEFLKKAILLYEISNPNDIENEIKVNEKINELLNKTNIEKK